MSSRTEDLIKALLNGETVEFNPHSRVEKYLMNCLDGSGTEGLPTPISRLDILLYQLAEVMSGGGIATIDDTQTYILRTDDGQEIPAVLVEEATVFDATSNDIRNGKMAVTDAGVTEGTKVIPVYYTHSGVKLIPTGRKFALRITDYDYTKFQAIICPFNTSSADSVSAEKVTIDDDVYNVLSTESISAITKDDSSTSVDLGITNDSGKLYVIRYFMYKEIY